MQSSALFKIWSNGHLGHFFLSTAFSSFCLGIPECAWAFCKFPYIWGKESWANRKMAIVLQLSVYQRTFKSTGVGQLFWNVLLSQNRWIYYGSDDSFRKAALHSGSFPYCLWNIKKCSQVKACIFISHSFSYAWDLVLCCGMQGDFKEERLSLVILSILHAV